MESAEHGIGRRRKNVSTAEIRVVDIEIWRVSRTADFRYVRSRTVSNVVPVDARKPRMILYFNIFHSFHLFVNKQLKFKTCLEIAEAILS